MKPQHRDTFCLSAADYREIAAMNAALDIGATYVDLFGGIDDAAWDAALKRDGVQNRAHRQRKEATV